MLCSQQPEDPPGSGRAELKAVPDPGPDERESTELKPLPQPLQDLVKDGVPLNPQATVVLNRKTGQLILRTEVACTDCILEMLLVPEKNREHETILRIRSKAYVIHAGLLHLGLEPGKPAVFSPKFVPPGGPVVSLEVVWLDEKKGLQRCAAQEWIRRNVHRYYTARLPKGPPSGIQFPWKELRWDRFNNDLLWFGPMSDADRDELLKMSDDSEFRKAIETFYREGQSVPMQADFVFVGSSLHKDEETGEEYYRAEGGHLICTSNFGDALLDVREESSSSDGAQAWEGWTERIPPVGTPVLLILSGKK